MMSPHANRRPRRPAQPEAGFTLLETVIALCIALVVSFGAIALFLYAASFNSGASDRARALAIAQDKVEELRAIKFSNLPASSTVDIQSGSTDAGKSDQRTFRVVTLVENDTTTNPADRQKKITVTVTPASLKGRFSTGDVSLIIVRTSETAGAN